mmetsp:Transcript_14304/g.27198  ORF Transcript_14304/g.27198 Transcript_14304/m.27198 type:complete len:295 (+) Transcript_14304:288-1172(+)
MRGTPSCSMLDETVACLNLNAFTFRIEFVSVHYYRCPTGLYPRVRGAVILVPHCHIRANKTEVLAVCIALFPPHILFLNVDDGQGGVWGEISHPDEMISFDFRSVFLESGGDVFQVSMRTHNANRLAYSRGVYLARVGNVGCHKNAPLKPPLAFRFRECTLGCLCFEFCLHALRNVAIRVVIDSSSPGNLIDVIGFVPIPCITPRGDCYFVGSVNETVHFAFARTWVLDFLNFDESRGFRVNPGASLRLSQLDPALMNGEIPDLPSVIRVCTSFDYRPVPPVLFRERLQVMEDK